MSDQVELYRWPDGSRMVRPLTRAGLTMSPPVDRVGDRVLKPDQADHYWDEQWLQLEADSQWIFILLNADGNRVDTLSISDPGEDIDDLSIEDIDIYQLRQGGSWDYLLKKFRAFYLDMLIPLNKVLTGALATNLYADYEFPMNVGNVANYVRSPEFAALQKQSEAHRHLIGERGLRRCRRRDDYLLAPLSDQGEIDLTDAINQARKQLKNLYRLSTPALKLQGHHEVSLFLDRFASPGGWSMSPERREAFKKKAGWEWIVIDDNDVVLGVGHTPLEALSDVQHFVWPDDLANNDKRLNLASWLAKWTEPGTPAFDVALYTMLNLPTPAALPHPEFVEWAKGRTNAD